MTQKKKREVPLALPSIGDEERQAILDVLETGWLTHGPKNKEFEEAFANYHGVAHAVSMNSCASALQVAIECQDIKGEVILPSFTWVASASAIVKGGALPVFADIQSDTCNIDPGAIESMVTSRTEAIMPVHYAGQTADMVDIMGIAQKHGLAVIEDSAETIGGTHDGRFAGSFDMGCFSFFPTKGITTGEGGMLTTNDGVLAQKVRCLIGHGIDKSTYEREISDKPWFRGASMVGYNFRMSNFQAAMGLAQFKKLDTLNNRRRDLADIYKKNLSSLSQIRLPFEKPGNKHVYQMYTIQVEDAACRDRLVKHLRNSGIGASVHFAPVVHEMKPFGNGKFRCGDMSNTQKVASQIVTLPMCPDMPAVDVEWVAETIKNFFSE